MRSIERVLQAHIATFGTFAVPCALSKIVSRGMHGRGGRGGELEELRA